MGMVHKGGNAVPFHGDHHPVSIYVGDQPTFEPIDQAQDGKTLTFENTYNDVAEVTVFGESTQDGEPTPEAPVPIESIKYVELVSRGRNLANVRNGSGSKINSYYVGVPIGIQVEIGKTYTISFDSSSTVEKFNMNVGFGDIHEFLKDGPYLIDQSSGRHSITFTVKASDIEEGSWLHLRPVRYSSPQTFDYSYGNISVTEGSTQHPYEPYRSYSRTLDLQGHELRSLPDGTHDELLVHRDGTVELVLRCDASMFDTSYPVSSEWKLATPQTIQLPSIDPLQTYYPYTFVDGNGADISAHVKVFE